MGEIRVAFSKIHLGCRNHKGRRWVRHFSPFLPKTHAASWLDPHQKGKSFLILMFLMAGAALSAQVTKATFGSLMYKIGTSWGKIQMVYVGNKTKVLEDGRMEHGSTSYSVKEGNSFSMVDEGIIAHSGLGPESATVNLNPFGRIKTLDIEMTKVTITLED